MKKTYGLFSYDIGPDSSGNDHHEEFKQRLVGYNSILVKFLDSYNKMQLPQSTLILEFEITPSVIYAAIAVLDVLSAINATNCKFTFAAGNEVIVFDDKENFRKEVEKTYKDLVNRLEKYEKSIQSKETPTGLKRY